MTTLYLAKEPDQGVRADLSRISDDLVVVDCLNAYGDYYRKKGYNCMSGEDFLGGSDVKFDLIIGNPPYQGGSESKRWVLWHQFLEMSLRQSDVLSRS